MNYITSTGSYYEGDKADVGDVTVPKKPSRYHAWNGSEWVLDFSAYKGAAITAVRTEAGRRINAVYPLATGKQSNMHKRTGQLLRKRIVGTLTAGELAEEAVLIAAGDWIDAVRAAENAATASILAGATASAVDAIVPVWPIASPPAWN